MSIVLNLIRDIILNILTKYENISDEDIIRTKQLYKEKKLDELNYIEDNNNEKNNNEKIWIRQVKSNRKKYFKYFTIALPLIYIASYFYYFLSFVLVFYTSNNLFYLYILIIQIILLNL